MKSALSTPVIADKKALRRSSIQSNQSNHSSEHNHTGSASASPDVVNRNRRRVTHANPNVKISEITDITRDRNLHEKSKTQPKPEAVYKFHCGGDISNDVKGIAGMHVEWNATFNKPLEQLIYPSLQRFDMSAYDEKRKIQQKLHGHYDAHFTAGTALSKSSTASSSGMTASNFNSTNLRQISCDLDNATSLENQKLFIHTPKWTVKLTSNSSTSRPHSRSRTSTEDGAALDTSTNKPVYDSLADEIDIEGENYLRQRIKDRYMAKIESERAEREYIEKMAARSSSPMGSPAQSRRSRKKGSALVLLEQESADMLVSRCPFIYLPFHGLTLCRVIFSMRPSRATHTRSVATIAADCPSTCRAHQCPRAPLSERN